MSGPKSSRYTLTAVQRRILAEQRRIEQEKQTCRSLLSSKLISVQQLRESFDGEIAVSDELFDRSGVDSGINSLVDRLRETIDLVKAKTSTPESMSLDALKTICAEVETLNRHAHQLYLEIGTLASVNDETLNKSIDEDVAGAFSNPEGMLDSFSISKQKMRRPLERMLFERPKLAPSLIDKLEAARRKLLEISDERFLKNYETLTVSPLLSECKRYLSEYEEIGEEYEATRSEYNALCLLAEVEPDGTICSRASLVRLRTEIKALENQLQEDDEQAYISNCIDEVMEDMGYTILGHRAIKKRNGKHFTNELYSYDDGTAINVTYTQEGRITMELGGIDTADRLPDATEARKLHEHMELFCEDFLEIEKRLVQKGVVLSKRISILPPAVEYAQIINTSDYDMEKDTNSFRAAAQKRKATKKAALQKEQ